ncbi:hypothetical protein [Pseudorhodoferax sp. Leaf274]|uniref:hypothetical protein n=1 Tax=Pseudorhodoferax sp. Leaf274 TaxID=1736318 RepID=UPI0012E1D001|nr:hypothetical protein [Pseudorhodoferax sp. Leaf274]
MPARLAGPAGRRRYRVEALTSVAAEASRAGQAPGDWPQRLAQALRVQGLAGIP